MEFQTYSMLESDLFPAPKVAVSSVNPLKILAAVVILAGIGYLIYQKFYREDDNSNTPI